MSEPEPNREYGIRLNHGSQVVGERSIPRWECEFWPTLSTVVYDAKDVTSDNIQLLEEVRSRVFDRLTKCLERYDPETMPAETFSENAAKWAVEPTGSSVTTHRTKFITPRARRAHSGVSVKFAPHADSNVIRYKLDSVSGTDWSLMQQGDSRKARDEETHAAVKLQKALRESLDSLAEDALEHSKAGAAPPDIKTYVTNRLEPIANEAVARVKAELMFEAWDKMTEEEQQALLDQTMPEWAKQSNTTVTGATLADVESECRALLGERRIGGERRFDEAEEFDFHPRGWTQSATAASGVAEPKAAGNTGQQGQQSTVGLSEGTAPPSKKKASQYSLPVPSFLDALEEDQEQEAAEEDCTVYTGVVKVKALLVQHLQRLHQDKIETQFDWQPPQDQDMLVPFHDQMTQDAPTRSFRLQKDRSTAAASSSHTIGITSLIPSQVTVRPKSSGTSPVPELVTAPSDEQLQNPGFLAWKAAQEDKAEKDRTKSSASERGRGGARAASARGGRDGSAKKSSEGKTGANPAGGRWAEIARKRAPASRSDPNQGTQMSGRPTATAQTPTSASTERGHEKGGKAQQRSWASVAASTKQVTPRQARPDLGEENFPALGPGTGKVTTAPTEARSAGSRSGFTWADLAKLLGEDDGSKRSVNTHVSSSGQGLSLMSLLAGDHPGKKA